MLVFEGLDLNQEPLSNKRTECLLGYSDHSLTKKFKKLGKYIGLGMDFFEKQNGNKFVLNFQHVSTSANEVLLFQASVMNLFLLLLIHVSKKLIYC